LNVGGAFALAMLLACATAQAGDAPAWVAAPARPSLDGESGKTWFDPAHGRTEGTFKAIYDSMQDQRDSVTGAFTTARFRYTYDAPIGEGGKLSPRHDESVTEVLLDCANRFSGTRSITYLLQGKVVGETRDADADILMMQSPEGEVSTVSDLCAFLNKA
jgi:hypothetical protein